MTVPSHPTRTGFIDDGISVFDRSFTYDPDVVKDNLAGVSRW
jgi:hypothetical protein